MAIEVFNRYEQKYMLSREIYENVIDEIEKHMNIDKFNVNRVPYMISNIYFDTENNDVIRNSLQKPVFKEKVRLRGYGVPGMDDKVYLEIKKKYKGIVNKRRTTLKLSDAYKFLKQGTLYNEDIKDYMNKQVLKELEFTIKNYNVKPKAYIAYDRIAFFDKNDPDLRVSFDFNIRTRRIDLHLENGDHGKKLLDDNIVLMEIKSAKAMPIWLTNLLAKYDIRKKSFSKYGTEFKNFNQGNYYDDYLLDEMIMTNDNVISFKDIIKNDEKIKMKA